MWSNGLTLPLRTLYVVNASVYCFVVAMKNCWKIHAIWNSGWKGQCQQITDGCFVPDWSVFLIFCCTVFYFVDLGYQFITTHFIIVLLKYKFSLNKKNQFQFLCCIAWVRSVSLPQSREKMIKISRGPGYWRKILGGPH